MVMDDFNLGYSHQSFEGLRLLDMSSYILGRTVLKMKRKDGEHLPHPYDNIFIHGVSVCDAEITDFSERYDTLKAARYIPDHLPVWVRLHEL